MTFMKIKASRVPSGNAVTYVGEKGQIFYDETSGSLRISDGVTPGGTNIYIAVANFSFGDFTASTNNLSTVNPNENFNILSNGTGSINLVGSLNIYQTSTGLTGVPIFSIGANSNIRAVAPNAGGTSGAIQIVGNTTGQDVSPNQTGVVLHVTGDTNLVNRNYFDGVNNYPLIAGRRYNGTPTAPTQVLSGQLIFRLVGQADTNTGFQTFGPAQIDFVATENQTATSQGGEVRINATPNGSPAFGGIVQVASFNATTGVTAISFNGPLTGNVTGNITGSAPAGLLTGTTLAPNVVSSSLTSVGTLTTGVWNATPIANTYLQNSSITVNGTSVPLGGSVTTYTAPTAWTPTLVFSGGGSATYSIQYGEYVKSGQHIAAFFTISITASTGTGNVSVGGLPFASFATTYNAGGGALDSYSFTTNPTSVTGVVNGSATSMVLYWHGLQGSTPTNSIMTATNLGTTATLVGRITYMTAV